MSKENQVEKLLYRRKEAAFALGISVRSVDTLIANKRVETRRYGKCVLIPASELRRIARSNDFGGSAS